MIKAIFLDIGGVLIINNVRKVISEWAKKLGVDPLELKTLSKEYSNLHMGGDTITYDEFINRKAVNWITAQELSDLQKEIWNSEYVNQELSDFINQEAKNFIWGIITNNYREAEELLLSKFKIPKFYKIFVTSAEVGVMKPDPKIYQAALEKTSLSPQEILFIDDSLENVEGAEKVDINGIQFINNQQLLRDFKKYMKLQIGR